MADAVGAQFAQSLAPKIEAILTGSNLESVSAKAVRKTLVGQGIDESFIKNYKTQIDEVTKDIYLRLSLQIAPGVAMTEEKPTYQDLNAAANVGVKREASSGVKREAPSGVKREAPSGSQTSDTKRARPAKVKTAALVNSSDGEGGTPVPKKKPKPRKKRVRAEGESPAPSPNNPFNKPMGLSPALSALLGETQCSRPQAVKLLWAYIKGHGLQDPTDKRYIMCDEKMMSVMGEPRVHMMTMNKILSSHFIPLTAPEGMPDPNIPVTPTKTEDQSIPPSSEPSAWIKQQIDDQL